VICELSISSRAQEAGSLQTSSSGIHLSVLSSGTPMPVPYYESEPQKAGYLDCECTRETYGCSIHPNTPAEWIASMQGSLVRIFQRLEEAKALREAEADSSPKCSEQLTLLPPHSSSSKTARESEPEAAMSSSVNSWRADIPGETESLARLMSAQAINGTAGGVSLPTLTVCGNWNRKGASASSGDGIATALKNLGPTLLASDADKGGPNARHGAGSLKLPRFLARLPTLTASDGMGGPGVSPNRKGGLNLRTAITMLPTVCATDYKSPYSAEGYARQAQNQSKPLRDTLVPSTGHRLTPAFAEWWMGWPIGWTALSAAGMAKYRSKRRPPSFCSQEARDGR